jgi:hypothetical protein
LRSDNFILFPVKGVVEMTFIIMNVKSLCKA